MKVDFFGSVKFSKPFKIFDVFLYLICVVFILTFLLGFAFPKKDVSSGFKVELNGKIVLYYYYGGTFETEESFSSLVEKNGNLITVYTDERKTEYNILNIDDSACLVSVSDSNCSARKDCVHSSPVNKDGGCIICMPHKLKITPIGSGYVPPVTN